MHLNNIFLVETLFGKGDNEDMLSRVSNRFLAVTILAIFVIALVGIIFNKSLESSKLTSTEVQKNSSVPASEQVSLKLRV